MANFNIRPEKENLISDSFNEGGSAYKSNLIVLITMYLILLLLNVGIGFVSWFGGIPETFYTTSIPNPFAISPNPFNVWFFVEIILLILVVTPISSGFTYTTILATRGEKFSFSTLFHFLHIKRYLFIIFQTVLASILLTIIIGLGLFLFILPGLYLIVRLFFTLHFIIDKQMTAPAAINASWKVTASNFWQTLVFVFILIIISGLVFLIPIIIFAFSLNPINPSLVLFIVGSVIFGVVGLVYVPWISCVTSAAYNLLVGEIEH